MNRRIKKQKSFARLATWPTVPATDSTDVHPFDQIAPDMKHSHYSIEVKSRRSFPAWIENALQQAEAARVDDEQVPLALHLAQLGPWRPEAVVRGPEG